MLDLTTCRDYIFYFGYVQIARDAGSDTFGDAEHLAQVNGTHEQFKSLDSSDGA